MSFLPGTFTAVPNPMMLPFLGLQNYYMMKAGGMALQAGKLLILNHSNLSAQNEINTFLKSEMLKLDDEVISLLNQSLQTFRPLITTLTAEFMQYFKILIDMGKAVAYQNPTLVDIPVANPQDFTRNQQVIDVAQRQFVEGILGPLLSYFLPSAAADSGVFKENSQVTGVTGPVNPEWEKLQKSLQAVKDKESAQAAIDANRLAQQQIIIQRENDARIKKAQDDADALARAREMVASQKRKLPSDPRTVISRRDKLVQAINDSAKAIKAANEKIRQGGIMRSNALVNQGEAALRSAKQNLLLLQADLTNLLNTYDFGGK